MVDFKRLTFVAGPGETHHDKAGKDIGRGNQAVRRSGAEAHTVFEDDGEEVGNSVGYSGGEHKNQSKPPDLKV